MQEGHRSLRVGQHRAEAAHLELEEDRLEQRGRLRVRALHQQVATLPYAERGEGVVVELGDLGKGDLPPDQPPVGQSRPLAVPRGPWPAGPRSAPEGTRGRRECAAWRRSCRCRPPRPRGRSRPSPRRSPRRRRGQAGYGCASRPWAAFSLGLGVDQRPRRPTTCGIVRSRIFTSSQSDQFAP